LSIEEKLKKSKRSALQMAVLTSEQKNTALKKLAEIIEKEKDFLISKNRMDLEQNKGKISEALYSRLELTDKKIKSVIEGIYEIASMLDPIGVVEWERDLKLGPHLKKISVPIGVIGVVFEARPDVNPQILSLILKSGNSVVLKGGSEAIHSNVAFQAVVEKLNAECSFLPSDWAQIIETREDFREMLKYDEYLDLVIPRGSNQLVKSVMDSTRAPVLGHADGICHIYVDPSADLDKSLDVILNSKTQYPSACNSVETLLIDSKVDVGFLLSLNAAASQLGVELRGCKITSSVLKNIKMATDTDWVTEYGEKILAVKIVENIDSAIDHINTYGSHHTDAIMAKDESSIQKFQSKVDSACVFVNASTRFADGFRFGMGAEVGISTSKTHARGPVGIEGLVSYKYLLSGDYEVV
jgi:glutamate-5-semialdehyde dehydrogenase